MRSAHAQGRREPCTPPGTHFCSPLGSLQLLGQLRTCRTTTGACRGLGRLQGTQLPPGLRQLLLQGRHVLSRARTCTHTLSLQGMGYSCRAAAELTQSVSIWRAHTHVCH